MNDLRELRAYAFQVSSTLKAVEFCTKDQMLAYRKSRAVGLITAWIERTDNSLTLRHEILISTGQTIRQQVCTLAHEIGHLVDFTRGGSIRPTSIRELILLEQRADVYGEGVLRALGLWENYGVLFRAECRAANATLVGLGCVEFNAVWRASLMLGATNA